jgi:hypothetical protein
MGRAPGRCGIEPTMVAIRDGEDNASRKDLFHGEEIVGSVVKYSTKKGEWGGAGG